MAETNEGVVAPALFFTLFITPAINATPDAQDLSVRLVGVSSVSPASPRPQMRNWHCEQAASEFSRVPKEEPIFSNPNFWR